MTTNNHPAHGPVLLERLHQISKILSKAAAQSDGGNLGYAMADAVKVIDEVLNAEPVAYWRYAFRADGFCYADGINSKKHHDAHPLSQLSEGDYWRVTPLYTTPPVPEGLLSAMEEVLRISDRDHDAWHKVRSGIASCRAAILQAGNHTEQRLDMVDHSGDGNEMVDCRLPFAQWLSQQNEPIDVDCGCVTTEAFYHWLRVAYEAGNSPVIGIDLASKPDRSVEVRYVAPPGYVMVPVEPTMEILDEFDSIIDYGAEDSKDAWSRLIAAAPQQEVK